MRHTWIQNADALATTPLRRMALEIAEAMYQAIDTEQIIQNAIRIEGSSLSVKGTRFNLSGKKRIKIIGFGKASCEAAIALEKILGDRIGGGIVIDIVDAKCEYLETVAGTHPRPSQKNVEASQRIVALSSEIQKEDLVIVIVSGGGSSLLCWPQEECDQGIKLYDDFMKAGGTIEEFNTVRKHISLLKGGGLAKLLYPATVIGLIFSDIPGDAYDMVASGPTFLDTTTVADAQVILDKYGLDGFDLLETPKDPELFQQVSNIVLISNRDAMQAISDRAKAFGLKAHILSNSLNDPPTEAAQKFLQAVHEEEITVAGGEISLAIPHDEGVGFGGRSQHMALTMLPHMKEGHIFLSLASDGRDNSDIAGALVDERIRREAEEKSVVGDAFLEHFDAGSFFKKIGDGQIMTGPTGANVSDIMFYLIHGEHTN